MRSSKPVLYQAVRFEQTILHFTLHSIKYKKGLIEVFSRAWAETPCLCQLTVRRFLLTTFHYIFDQNPPSIQYHICPGTPQNKSPRGYQQ